MLELLQSLLENIASGISRIFNGAGALIQGLLRGLGRIKGLLIVLASLGALAYTLAKHPPVQTLENGEVGIRSNRLTGSTAQFHEGPVVVIPALYELQRYSLRDHVYSPASEEGNTPFQSIEGLSFGVDLSVRYALDPARIAAMSAQLPDDIDGQIVAPAVQGVIYKVFTRYTIKEIFSSKRAEIQQAIETDLKGSLAHDGILLRGVQVGKVDLPQEYRSGMERLLAEELEAQKMQYTLALKEQQVKQSRLEAEADKARREKEAEAAGNEQIIAARAQEEAMKHVLPFKQKQIEQRKLEAEAEKQARIKNAEGNAEARRIEAAGEADSRQKLADAESYRLEHLGKVASTQMERDGVLLSKYPLLIQKTMADKLSDKVSVIIAPPSTNSGFIGSALLGQNGSGNNVAGNQGNQ